MAVIRLFEIVLETRRGGITQRKEEDTNGGDETLAASVREENGNTEWIEDSDGALERRDYDEPDAHKQGRMRQHVLDDDASRVDGQPMHLDDVRQELD